jgi:hypothetical protein
MDIGRDSDMIHCWVMSLGVYAMVGAELNQASSEARVGSIMQQHHGDVDNKC